MAPCTVGSHPTSYVDPRQDLQAVRQAALTVHDHDRLARDAVGRVEPPQVYLAMDTQEVSR